MSLIRAIDFSYYQGLPDAAWFKLIREKHDIRLAIIQRVIGTIVNPAYPAAAERAREAGMEVATYVWPPEAVELEPTYGDVAFVALDVEAEAGVNPGNLWDIEDVGLYPVIYTNKPAWAGAMGANTAYHDNDLWHAEYIYYRIKWRGVSQDWPDYLPLVDYGGWVKPIGWQFAGEVTLEGVSVDLNVFEEDVLLTSQQVQAMIDKSVSKAIYDANARHYADDHQYLQVEKLANKRIKLRNVKGAEAAMVQSQVKNYRVALRDAGIRPPTGAAGEPDPDSEE